jgi:murein DD-endopeptidase MepM/ murein hydrolase activator NlpD
MTDLEPAVVDSPALDAPADAPPATHRALPRRSLLISAGIIALLGGLLAAVVFTGGPGRDRAPVAAAAGISAAGWVGPGDAGPPPAAAADAGTGATSPGGGYAPSPADYLDGAPDAGALPEAAEELPADGGIMRRGTVKAKVPVLRNLTGVGLSAAEAQQLINALQGLFDFRRAQPGQTFEVRLDPATREPTYFRYDASLVEVYEVRREGAGFVGRQKRIPTQKVRRSFGGTIASSLYKTLAGLGAQPSLTGRVVDVLSTQVDFYKEQRPGDTFRLLVDEERLGEHFLGYGPVLALEYVGVKAGRRRFFRFQAADDDPTYFDEKGISVPRSALRIPLHYTRISSPFGMRWHPVLKRKQFHNGVDFAAPTGTTIWACAAGTVVVADTRGANGRLVSIDHEEGLVSHYAHLSRFAAGIKAGVAVKQGQVVGYVGSTGRSTGPHLHYGLKKNGKFLDPLTYKVRPGRPVAPRQRAELDQLIKRLAAELDATRIRPADGPLEQVPEAGQEVLSLEGDF